MFQENKWAATARSAPVTMWHVPSSAQSTPLNDSDATKYPRRQLNQGSRPTMKTSLARTHFHEEQIMWLILSMWNTCLWLFWWLCCYLTALLNLKHSYSKDNLRITICSSLTHQWNNLRSWNKCFGEGCAVALSKTGLKLKTLDTWPPTKLDAPSSWYIGT